MTNQPMTLRDIALKASDRFGGVRGRALGREAEKAGVKIVYTTIDKIIAGTYRSKPTDATLRALATLAQVPLDDVYLAAERPMPQAPLADELPDGSDTLTPTQREVVIGIVRQFAAANRERWEIQAQLTYLLNGGRLSDVDRKTVLTTLTRMDLLTPNLGRLAALDPDEMVQDRANEILAEVGNDYRKALDLAWRDVELTSPAIRGGGASFAERVADTLKAWMSEPADTSTDAIAAHEEEVPIVGEQEESDTP